MFLFQVKQAAQTPKEASGDALFSVLKYWVKTHRIPITILPRKKGEDEWGFSFSNTGLTDNRIAMRGKSSIILFHECAHRFLIDRMGYVAEHYLDIKGIRADAEGLKKAIKNGGAANMGANSSSGQHAGAEETSRFFYIMDSLAIAEFDSHAKPYPEHTRLNSLLISIFKAESALPDGIKKKLEKALGRPQYYQNRSVPLYRAGEVIGHKKSPGHSIIGNITDESSVFRYSSDASGHPMESYHEFFASLSTSLALGGGRVLSGLDAFASIAREEPGVGPLFSQYKALLSGSLLSLEWFYLDLAAIPSAKKLPDVANFNKNIQLLEAWLKAN